jgi:hypothetical protein
MVVALGTGSGGTALRGRKPQPLTVADADVPLVRAVAHRRPLCSFPVEPARIVRAVAAGASIPSLASRRECDRTPGWRVCRRSERGGLKELLFDEPRLGRPQEFSPPPTRAPRGTGLPGAGRRGTAPHPRDQPGFGPASSGRWHRRVHQPAHRAADSARGGRAAAAHAFLADLPPRRTVHAACGARAWVLGKCGTAGTPRDRGGGGR